jgi:hypothetical protein
MAYNPLSSVSSGGSGMTGYSRQGLDLSADRVPGDQNAENLGSPRHLPFMPVVPKHTPGYLGSVATPQNIGEHLGAPQHSFSPGAGLFPPKGGRRGRGGTGNIGARAVSGPYGAPGGK